MRPCWCRFCRDCSRLLANPAATADLIAFLQALPEGRKRRGVRYPQWLLLLMAILGILSGCRSARDLERFAKRHHQVFSAALDLELPKAPCDSTFLYLFERVELEQLFALLREWMLAQIAGQNKDFDQLICDGKTLRGSAAQPELRLVRQRWAIENQWHWPRDTQLGEDAHRYSQRNGVQVLALLRTLALNLLRCNGFRSIRAGLMVVAHDFRRMLGWVGILATEKG